MEKYFSDSCYIKPNLDCNYIFPMDLAPSGIKSIVEALLQIKFRSIQQDLSFHSACIQYNILLLVNENTFLLVNKYTYIYILKYLFVKINFC